MQLKYRFTKEDIKSLYKVQGVNWGVLYTYLAAIAFLLVGLGLCLSFTALIGVGAFSACSLVMLACMAWFFSQRWSKTHDQAVATDRVADLREKYFQFWSSGIGVRNAWWWVTSFEVRENLWILKHNESFAGIIPFHAAPVEEMNAVESLIRERVEHAQVGDDTLELGQVSWTGERMRHSYEMTREEYGQIMMETAAYQKDEHKYTTADQLRFIAVFVVILLVLIAGIFYGRQIRLDFPSLGFGIVVFIAAAIAWLATLVSMARRMNAQVAAKRSDDEFEQKTTFIWTADGIVLASRCSGTLLSWRGLKRVAETKLTVRLERVDFHHNFVPKHVFDNDPNRIEEFVKNVNACIEHAALLAEANVELDENGNPYRAAGG
jgi:hypothetical protein